MKLIWKHGEVAGIEAHDAQQSHGQERKNAALRIFALLMADVMPVGKAGSKDLQKNNQG